MRKKHWYRVSHKEDKGNVELLNSFFSNAVKHFKFPKGSDSNPLAEFISHPIFKAMLKYKNHPSIIAINEMDQVFPFALIPTDVFKKIKSLKARKAI